MKTVDEQYFPVVLFITLYKVVLTFESVDEILKCDHSNESYWAVLSCGAVYYAAQGDSNFESADEFLNCDWATEHHFPIVLRFSSHPREISQNLFLGDEWITQKKTYASNCQCILLSGLLDCLGSSCNRACCNLQWSGLHRFQSVNNVLKKGKLHNH